MDRLFYIAIRLWAGKPRNRGSILVWTKDYSVSQNLTKRTGTPSLLFTENPELYPEAKAAGA
jgi:hypothetical protein